MSGFTKNLIGGFGKMKKFYCVSCKDFKGRAEVARYKDKERIIHTLCKSCNTQVYHVNTTIKELAIHDWFK